MLPELRRICHRESVGPGAGACRPVRVHAIDLKFSARAWRKSVAVGWLDPECQPLDAGPWSTRGSWGLFAAYHARFLPACSPAWLFDVPLVSAYVAAKKLEGHCARREERRHPASTRWGRCDWKRSRSNVRRLAGSAGIVQLTAHPAHGDTVGDATSTDGAREPAHRASAPSRGELDAGRSRSGGDDPDARAGARAGPGSTTSTTTGAGRMNEPEKTRSTKPLRRRRDANGFPVVEPMPEPSKAKSDDERADEAPTMERIG